MLDEGDHPQGSRATHSRLSPNAITLPDKQRPVASSPLSIRNVVNNQRSMINERPRRPRRLLDLSQSDRGLMR